jgi:hypothetical protein
MVVLKVIRIMEIVFNYWRWILSFESFKMSIISEPIGTTDNQFNSGIITLADLKRFHITLKEYYGKTNHILYDDNVYDKVILYLDRCFLLVRHEKYNVDFELFNNSSIYAEFLRILRKCDLSEFKWDLIHRLDIVKIFKVMYDITDNAINNFTQELDLESVVFSDLEFRSISECLTGYRHLYSLVSKGLPEFIFLIASLPKNRDYEMSYLLDVVIAFTDYKMIPYDIKSSNYSLCKIDFLNEHDDSTFRYTFYEVASLNFASLHLEHVIIKDCKTKEEWIASGIIDSPIIYKLNKDTSNLPEAMREVYTNLINYVKSPYDMKDLISSLITICNDMQIDYIDEFVDNFRTGIRSGCYDLTSLWADVSNANMHKLIYAFLINFQLPLSYLCNDEYKYNNGLSFKSKVYCIAVYCLMSLACDNIPLEPITPEINIVIKNNRRVRNDTIITKEKFLDILYFAANNYLRYSSLYYVLFIILHMPSSVISTLCNIDGTANITILDKFNNTEYVSRDYMLEIINKGSINYGVYDIAGLTYLPEFINASCAGDTKRLLKLFTEQYIRLCYNHVMNRDK